MIHETTWELFLKAFRIDKYFTVINATLLNERK